MTWPTRPSPPPPGALAAAYRRLLGPQGAARVTREQALAAEAAVRGRSVLLHLPTGAGKSLAFQAPALVRSGPSRPTLVVSPLVALIADQVAGLRRRGVEEVAAVLGGNPGPPPATARLVYTTPECLLQNRAMQAWAEELARRGPAGLARVVLDEAHCLLEWGTTFRPSYLALCRWRAQLFPTVPVTLATATIADDDIAHLARLFGVTPVRPARAHDGDDDDDDNDVDGGGNPSDVLVVVQHVTDRANLRLEVARKHPGAAVALLQGRVREDPAIVYCLTRREAEELCLELVRSGARAGVYHGGLPTRRREYVRRQWMGGQLSVLCATSAFGMGIDRPDVRWVIHNSLPFSLSAYSQQIGRAGRDGRPATCVLLYAPEDKTRVSAIPAGAVGSDHDGGALAYSHREMEDMAAFCEATGCRREMIFSNSGYSFDPAACCANCECGRLLDIDVGRYNREEEESPPPRSPPADEVGDDDGNGDHKRPTTSQVEYYYRKVLNEVHRCGLPKREALSRRVVQELLVRRPGSVAEMAMVRGVGHAKAKRFSRLFPLESGWERL